MQNPTREDIQAIKTEAEELLEKLAQLSPEKLKTARAVLKGMAMGLEE